MKPVGIGIIGCGNISDIYIENLKKFESTEVVAYSDLIMERATEKAERHGIGKACDIGQLLANDKVEIILNLTVPQVHGELAIAALNAGKSVYNEKPLAVKRDEAQEMIALAEKKGLLIGCAPDTFLGAGLQTSRKVIDDGWIGRVISATCFMQIHGPEDWHPDPDFFYQPGAGPMFDMGPYCLTALIALNGPVRRVCGSTQRAFTERLITSKPKFGQTIKVNTETHVAGILDFENGAVATMITTFDVWAHNLPNIEIHGTNGSMVVPDPNTFGGPIRIRRAGNNEWTDMPLSHGYAENNRGLGVADMAHALRSVRRHRAHVEMAYHVLDIMHAFHDSSNTNRHIEIQSTCRQPEPFPLDMRPYVLD